MSKYIKINILVIDVLIIWSIKSQESEVVEDKTAINLQ